MGVVMGVCMCEESVLGGIMAKDRKVCSNVTMKLAGATVKESFI